MAENSPNLKRKQKKTGAVTTKGPKQDEPKLTSNKT